MQYLMVSVTPRGYKLLSHFYGFTIYTAVVPIFMAYKNAFCINF